jgi:acyl-CoA thioesterase
MAEPNAINFEENRTRSWLRIGGISSPPGSIIHHCGLTGLTDVFLLDVFVRLHNLQLGLGEGRVGKDHRDSPYNKSTKRPVKSLKDWPKSDFSALVTLNHTIHFHDLEGMKADEWVLMEGHTTWASRGRVLLHSRLWTRGGRLVATCTQEVGFFL